MAEKNSVSFSLSPNNSLTKLAMHFSSQCQELNKFSTLCFSRNCISQDAQCCMYFNNSSNSLFTKLKTQRLLDNFNLIIGLPKFLRAKTREGRNSSFATDPTPATKTTTNYVATFSKIDSSFTLNQNQLELGSEQINEIRDFPPRSGS